MGGGDVKLAALIGSFLGIRAGLVALFSAFLMGAFLGVVLMIVRKKGRKDAIPFAPFLSVGTLIGFLFSGEIIGYYLQFHVLNT
jgi:leader peptidase (prepilin peptidase)/N-methyltransferase